MTLRCPNVWECIRLIANHKRIADEKCPKKRGKGELRETCWRVGERK